MGDPAPPSMVKDHIFAFLKIFGTLPLAQHFLPFFLFVSFLFEIMRPPIIAPSMMSNYFFLVSQTICLVFVPFTIIIKLAPPIISNYTAPKIIIHYITICLQG